MFSVVQRRLLQDRGTPRSCGGLTESDVDAARTVAVVNETFGRTYFSKEDPVGGGLVQPVRRDADRKASIIGIVAEARNRGLLEGIMPEA
jgi:hypothetical protein